MLREAIKYATHIVLLRYGNFILAATVHMVTGVGSARDQED